MTTVAYDGVTLSSDSRASSGWKHANSCQKIFTNVGDYQAIGFCGDYSCVAPLLHWLANPDEHEYCSSLTEGDYAAIAVDHDGQAWMFHSGVKLPMTVDHLYAVGSGADFAMAAMTLGKTSAQAVKLAARLDLCTGGKIVTVPISKGKKFNHKLSEA